MICAESITFKYPHGDAPAIKEFSAQFMRGEITAISGSNGCGKTTLTKLLTGILRPSSGCVTIDGSNTDGMSLFEIGQRVGYVFQNPSRQLFCGTVYDEVAYGLRNLRMDEAQIEQKVSIYLELFDLAKHRVTFPGKLSFGEKQRLALAAVLALGTSYLVLDEPTTSLDARRQHELGDTLIKLRQEQNCGIIVVSHADDFIDRYTDRELVMTR